jgi:scyllo-inositol 2-dehydrogenase (NADP+)
VSPLRVALLGYGLAGRVIHRPLLQRVPELALTHVVTADPGRQAAARAEVPGAQVLTSAEQLWQCADAFDVVVVATPNDVHVPLARTAVDLRKAVVVDKPLALSATEAATLVAHAATAGVPLSVFHNRRWDSDSLTARDLLADGRLGRVHRLEARFTRFRPQVQQRWREEPGSGGVLLDLGTHLVDQAVHLLGPVRSVYSEVQELRSGAVVDDDAFLALTHASGARSLLWCSAAAPWTGPRLVLQGSAAGWAKQDLDGQEAAQRDGAEPGPEPDGTLWDEAGTHPVPSRQGDWAAFYRGFAGAVLAGRPVPVDPQDAVEVQRVLEAARRSSGAGEVMRLEGPEAALA